jgi:hypothetical protein
MIKQDTPKNKQTPRIFISYKRHAEPDEQVALEIFQALKQQYDVFIDQALPVGTRWSERIDEELQQADFLVALLSANSIQSEMIQTEIATAYDLANDRGGPPPTILPVRLAYRERLQYRLRAYLDRFNAAFWPGPEHTVLLIEELQKAISANSPIMHGYRPGPPTAADRTLSMPQPQADLAALEVPRGAVNLQSLYYIERQSDRIAHDAMRRQGVTMAIKAPRQMGKSSLLRRLADAGGETGKQVVLLDFHLLQTSTLGDEDAFFRKFCTWLTHELGQADRVQDYWNNNLSNPLRCTNYLGAHLLPALQRPLLLGMDEVDRVFGTPFRSDFFAMLRAWHEQRAHNTLWKQLDLVLVTSTEPYLFIEHGPQSPFNVAQEITLADLTHAQVAELNDRHGSPLQPQHLGKLMTLSHGHPYLVRQALYCVASQQMSPEELFQNAASDHGPFGDHLRHYFILLQNKSLPDKDLLLSGLRQIIGTHALRVSKDAWKNEEVLHRLIGAGLVRKEGNAVVPRCQLYADYFQRCLPKLTFVDAMLGSLRKRLHALRGRRP